MRVLLFLFLVSCGGKVEGSEPDASAVCTLVRKDVGNCFSNVEISDGKACGFPFGAAGGSGTTCDRVCMDRVKSCTFDGAHTVRCEYCH